MKPGLRVVRGPDWKWQNQDEGEGHVGTLVEIDGTDPRVAYVRWDSGKRANYRVGQEDSYDLRVYDNAPIGIKHPGIQCDACDCCDILGVRWKCSRCHDFDLCHECYMSDKHDLSHPFTRHDTPSSHGVLVSKRAGSTRVRAKGIFPGAKVIRGPDWQWADQDGGRGKIGKVTEIQNVGDRSGRSQVRVTWQSGSSNSYRLAVDGKVDLTCQDEGTGLTYYKDHLPLVGKLTGAPVFDAGSAVIVGDRVRVELDEETLKQMQNGHGGWSSKLPKYMSKTGTVREISDSDDIRVQFDETFNWVFHPASLAKVPRFYVGDVVQIREGMADVKKLQEGHGGWTDEMRTAVGKSGKVLAIDADGDLRVEVGHGNWALNPEVCTRLSRPAQAETNKQERTITIDGQNIGGLLGDLFVKALLDAVGGPQRQSLVQKAANGDLAAVRELTARNRGSVDEKASGKTALQVASYYGHVETVTHLLSVGATRELTDEDGDTALHYSIFGGKAKVCELLIQKGADVNAVNKKEKSTDCDSA